MSDCKVVLHGTLIDGTGADPVADSALVIREGCVEHVGRAVDVSVPRDAEIIDAAGKTVMPGMIEGHAHVGGDYAGQQVLRLSLQRGITTVATVSGNPPGCQLRDAIEAGQVRGCSRLVVGSIVTPTHGHVKFRTADGPWEVRKAVREMVEAGSDFIKTAASGGFWGEDEVCAVRNYTYEELEALADEAHAWGLPVAVHVHTQPGLNNAIRAGLDMIHHGAFIDDEALEGLKERDLYYVPTLRVTCQKNIDAWPDRPWMKAEMEQASPIHRAGVRKAHKMGIKLAVGSDYPGSAHVWKIGDATPWELMELVQCGLSPMEAIVAGTRNTAEALQILEQVGTLEPGKRADLIVLEGNPLDDIGVLYQQENILIVLKDGVVESTDEEHKRHYKVREQQPEGRPQ